MTSIYFEIAELTDGSGYIVISWSHDTLPRATVVATCPTHDAAQQVVDQMSAAHGVRH